MVQPPPSKPPAGAAPVIAPTAEQDLTPEQLEKRRKFRQTLRKIMREERPMSDAEMAAMFDEDGDLGSQMRRMLLSS